MGLRQEKLKTIVGKTFKIKSHSKPTSNEILDSKYSESIFRMYKELNGQLDLPPTRFGQWDVSTDKFIIELDEERHFNRYRLKTLDSAIYSSWNYFSVSNYKSHCTDKEQDCLKAAHWGKNWKNPSTEKQFGQSDNEGILSKKGSSRWRQRAYYDFVKDISSKIIEVPILRISIYDIFNGTSIDKILRVGDLNLMTEIIDNKLRAV